MRENRERREHFFGKKEKGVREMNGNGLTTLIYFPLNRFGSPG